MLLNLAAGLAAALYIAIRQLRVLPAKTSMRLPVILAVIGAIRLAQFLDQHGHHPGAVFASLAGSLLIAILFALLRTATIHVWLSGELAWRKGGVLTVLLWLLSVAAHLGYDFIDDRGDLDGFGSATLLLFLAVTWTIQRLLIQGRARRLAAADRAAQAQAGGGEPDAGPHRRIHWP